MINTGTISVAQLASKEWLFDMACTEKTRTPEIALKITVSLKPLHVLFESARHGFRVYELMHIKRPGDILHYLMLRLDEADPRLIEHVNALLKTRHSHMPPIHPPLDIADFLPYSAVNDGINRGAEDFHSFFWPWQHFLDHPDLKHVCRTAMAICQDQQAALRQSDAPLIQHEIRLIDQHRHARDACLAVERQASTQALHSKNLCQADVTPAILAAIKAIAARPEVQSVSCCLRDLRVWKILALEQIKRVSETGLRGREAFRLAGPDSGLGDIPVNDWGIDVHIPYEGAVVCDFFIMPHWRNLCLDRADKTGMLAINLTTGRPTRYLMTERDLGESKRFAKKFIDGWYFYLPGQRTE